MIILQMLNEILKINHRNCVQEVIHRLENGNVEFVTKKFD